jgi:hypothetical protein
MPTTRFWYVMRGAASFQYPAEPIARQCPLAIETGWDVVMAGNSTPASRAVAGRYLPAM